MQTNECGHSLDGLSQSLRFDGQFVLVTGGSRGLGRAFALELARLGATVVINSTGGEDDDHKGQSASTVTLGQIESAGGQGSICDCSVMEADRIVSFCQQNYGRLDAIVHAAGVVRDKRLVNLGDEDWQAVTEVSLDAAFRLTRAAWPLFLDQEAGRLVFVGSSSGLYGNFGQANYSAAKAGLVGLAETIATEGGKRGIHANVICPVASTRMNRGLLPDKHLRSLTAEHVAPVAAWLAHPQCADNGNVYEVAGGWIGRVRWERSAGVSIPGREFSIQDVASRWTEASNFSTSSYPESPVDSLKQILQLISRSQGEP